jgi:DNA-directed RNA polymerase specialized sigma24 family protein
VAVDAALVALAAVDARTSQVVELRFFGGLSVEETAEVLKVSPETVKRDWRFAKPGSIERLTDQRTMQPDRLRQVESCRWSMPCAAFSVPYDR